MQTCGPTGRTALFSQLAPPLQRQSGQRIRLLASGFLHRPEVAAPRILPPLGGIFFIADSEVFRILQHLVVELSERGCFAIDDT